jgi:hypothetical protein
VPNRAVDVDSRALPACSCFISIDYLFTPHFPKWGGRRIGKVGPKARVTLPPPIKGVSRYGVKKEVYILIEQEQIL